MTFLIKKKIFFQNGSDLGGRFFITSKNLGKPQKNPLETSEGPRRDFGGALDRP